MRIYTNDFIEDLNYRKVILSIGEVEPTILRVKLEMDNVGHLYRFDACLENKLTSIENCDLQDVDTENADEFGNSLLYLIIDEGYVVYTLRYDSGSMKFFAETNIG